MININKTTVCVDLKCIDLSNIYKENTGTLFADTLERSTTALEVYTFLYHRA